MKVSLRDLIHCFLMDEFQVGHQEGQYNLQWERPNSRHSTAGLRLVKTGVGFVPFKIRITCHGSRRLSDFCDHFGTKRSTPDLGVNHIFVFHPVWLDQFLKDGDMDKTFLVITPIEEKADV